MSEIGDAHERLDQLSERVGQFGEGIIGVSNEPRYASIASRTLRAGQLAVDLAGALTEICTDIQDYGTALAPYDREGPNCLNVRELAEEVTMGFDGSLGDVPDSITAMAGFTTGALRSELETYLTGFADLASRLQRASTKLNKVGENLPSDVQEIEERVTQRSTAIRARIQKGKSGI